MQKYRMLRDRLAVELPDLELSPSQAATAGELALVHEPRYITAVLEGGLTVAEQREIGFPWSPSMAERACHSVGATILAARQALYEGLSGNLAGGTHHASAGQGGGFCVFNDLAVAARLMQAEWHRLHRRVLRVAVIDLDVHQGNGTAAIFRDDPTIFTLSMHGEKNFPFRKVRGDLDVDLPDGCEDEAYLDALDRALKEMWQRHDRELPGLIFYQAGVDAHVGDRLGRLNLSAAGLRERDRRVFAAARERGIPVVLTMGGGYGKDLDVTVDLQVSTWREAQASWGEGHRRPASPQ